MTSKVDVCAGVGVGDCEVMVTDRADKINVYTYYSGGSSEEGGRKNRKVVGLEVVKQGTQGPVLGRHVK